MQKFFSAISWLPKYLISAALIIVVLYPKFPFIRIPGIYVSIRLEDFLLLILGLITAVKIIPNIKKYLTDKILVSIGIFFLVGLLSLLSAVFLTQTVVPTIGALHFLRRFEYFIPLVAVLTLFSKQNIKTNLDFYIKTLMILVFILFIYGLGQRYLSFPIIDTQNDEYSKGIALLWTPGAHINATFAGHYDLAAFLVLALPIFSTFFFLTDKIKFKLLCLATVISGLWLLGASLSRFSLVSWVVASSFPLILLRKYKGIIYILVAAILVLITNPSLLGRYGHFFDIYAATPVAVSTPAPAPAPFFEDRSTSIRLNVEWPRAIRAFTKNPLIGTGYSSISLATDNDYLRLLGEVGLLGFAAFALIFLRIGQEITKYFKHKEKFTTLEKAYLLGIMGAIVGTFASAIFIDIFEASKFATIFWLLVGYAVMTVRSTVNE